MIPPQFLTPPSESEALLFDTEVRLRRIAKENRTMTLNPSQAQALIDELQSLREKVSSLRVAACECSYPLKKHPVHPRGECSQTEGYGSSVGSGGFHTIPCQCNLHYGISPDPDPETVHKSLWNKFWRKK